MMDTRTYLAHRCARLKAGHDLEIRAFYRGGARDGKFAGRCFGNDPEKLAAFAEGLGPGKDVYRTCNPRRDEIGTEEGVPEIWTLQLDADAKLFGGSKPDALAAIEAFPFPPTWIIDSGGGYQVEWDIEPLEATPANKALVKGILLELYRVFGGADSVHDCARIFRLPGTRNHKYPERPPVMVVRHDPSALYAIDDFLAVVPPPVEMPRPPRPALHFDDPTAEQLREMLRFIPPQGDYKTHWVRVLAAIHSVLPGPEGEAIAEEWSPGTGGNSVARKFKSFKRAASATNAASIGTIVYLAKQGGWQPPAPPQRPTSRPSAPGVSPAPLEQSSADDERYAALVAENDALRRRVETMTTTHQSVIRTLQNDQLSASERITAIFMAFEIANQAHAGKADERGATLMPAWRLADKTKQSVSTCRTQLARFEKMGVIEKEYRSGGLVKRIDPKTGEEKLTPVSDVLVVVKGAEGTTVADVLRVINAVERPDDLPRAGGKRDACASCGSTNTHREVRVVCDECGHVSKPMGDHNGPLTPVPAAPTSADLADALAVDEADETAPSVPLERVHLSTAKASYPPGEVTYHVEEAEQEEEDVPDSFFCNWPGCTARLKLGQVYCDHHRDKPHVPPPPRVPLIAQASATAATADAAQRPLVSRAGTATGPPALDEPTLPPLRGPVAPDSLVARAEQRHRRAPGEAPGGRG